MTHNTKQIQIRIFKKKTKKTLNTEKDTQTVEIQEVDMVEQVEGTILHDEK